MHHQAAQEHARHGHTSDVGLHRLAHSREPAGISQRMRLLLGTEEWKNIKTSDWGALILNMDLIN